MCGNRPLFGSVLVAREGQGEGPPVTEDGGSQTAVQVEDTEPAPVQRRDSRTKSQDTRKEEGTASSVMCYRQLLYICMGNTAYMHCAVHTLFGHINFVIGNFMNLITLYFGCDITYMQYSSPRLYVTEKSGLWYIADTVAEKCSKCITYYITSGVQVIRFHEVFYYRCVCVQCTCI